MDISLLGILGGVAFAAGFFDAIAGGGGLITLPALMVAGVNPVNAIATNKVQAAAATVSATAAFARKGMIDWKAGRGLVMFSAIGGIAGATLVSLVNKAWLQALVPILLVLIAAYFALTPSMSEGQKRRQRLSLGAFTFAVAPVLGAYDGFFGPGVGSFFLVGFVALCGLQIMQAMSMTKLANAACNLGSLSVFAMSGLIIWPIALTMAVAAFAGAQLGARAAVRVGPKLVKPMIIVACLAMACKLLADEENPLRKGFTLLLN
ncbi:MAG: TSUP family transporter [Acidovorax sp.]|uniref:TSUP family transporter n=1 Tax=Acidovorax sp. TaxID=1872122 RepID=UPI0039E4FB21